MIKQDVINLIGQLSEIQIEKVVSFIKIIQEEKEESALNKEQLELLELLNYTVNTERGDFAENHDKYIYGE